jgi:hypothetical protein
MSSFITKKSISVSILDKINNMEVAVNSNGQLPAYAMLENLNKSVNEVIKKKREEIIKLFNELFKKEYMSLLHFKDILQNYFTNLKDVYSKIKILESHKNNLGLKLDKIKPENSDSSDSVSDSSDSDESNSSEDSSKKKSTKKHPIKKTKKPKVIDINKEIFSILSKLLGTINYKFKKGTYFGKPSYVIIIK